MSSASTAPLGPAFRDEMALTNRRRTLVLVPVLLVLHAALVLVFRVPEADRAALPPRVLAWHEGIVATHAVTFGAGAILVALLLGFPGPRAAARLSALGAALYMAHSAVLASVDQLTGTDVTPFVGCCLGLAIAFTFRFRTTLAIYALGAVTFVAGMSMTQPVASARLAGLTNGLAFVAIGLGMAWVLLGGRRRDFVQRATIDRQSAALAALNAGLERRVEEQVSEIVARAEEVSRLNAQLQVQVKSRSAELTMALAKLARQYHEDGSLKRGSLLAGRFEIGPMLGAGGMGAVYAGHDRASGAQVAIKVSQASSTGQLDAWRRFLQEAATTATIDHPAVVRMLHVDVSEEGLLFQVQELVDGSTLQSRVRDGEPWEEGAVARLGAVLCEALAVAHARGIVHRDVKPANLMLTSSAPGLKLLDFGIAKLRTEALAADGVTHTGALVGTPVYMSPEQVHGDDVTDRADVYGVGVVLFLLATGKLPFEGPTARSAMMASLLDPVPDARVLAPAISEELAARVQRCLSKKPEERPTASELGAELAAFADARGVPALDALEREGALHADRARATSTARTIAFKSVPEAIGEG